MNLKELVEKFFQVGDYIQPDMDTKLEEFKQKTGIDYQYVNIFSNAGGFWAMVYFLGKDYKVKMFVDGDDLGHFVRAIEIEEYVEE